MKSDDRQKWIDAIETHQEFDRHALRWNICELHFRPEQINRSRLRDKLIKRVAPSIFPVKKYKQEYVQPARSMLFHLSDLIRLILMFSFPESNPAMIRFYYRQK